MNQFQHDNDLPPAGPPSPGGDLWGSWSSGRILALALLLLSGNFFVQLVFYGTGGRLFLPVLMGATVGVLLPVALVVRRSGLHFAPDLGLNNPGIRNLMLAAAVAVAALVPTSLLAELSLRLHPVDPIWVAMFRENLPQSPGAYVLAFVAVVLAAPLAEEIIFRGLLHRLAARLWGGAAATILSSLVFGIIHSEPWFLFGLIGVGLMLAVVYERTRSITACFVTHAVHNAISLGLMIVNQDVVVEPSPLTAIDWGWGAVSLVALLALVQWLRPVPTSPIAAARDRY
jgi:membrane protease YdiL (CAAX protease family)